MPTPVAYENKTRCIRGSKIPILLPNATNLEHGSESAVMSTPISSKNKGKSFEPIVGRILMPPIVQKNIKFSSTQIIHYNFNTVGLVKLASVSNIPVCPFIFSGLDKSSIAEANKMPNSPSKTFGRCKSDQRQNGHQGKSNILNRPFLRSIFQPNRFD